MSTHRRSSSRTSQTHSPPPHGGSPLPSQTHHTSLLPHVLPAPALVESVAGGAHFSGGGRPQSPEDFHRTSNPPPPSELRKRHSSSESPHGHGAATHRNSSGHHRGHSGSWDDDRNNLSEGKKRVLSDLKELYGCRPSVEIFERSWRRDAVFEDPLCIARGYEEYTAQWYAMPKVFASSQTIRSRVMSSTQAPNRLVLAHTQEYTYRWFGKKKVIESVVTLDFDGEDKIMRMVDQWDGDELPERFGAGVLRRANGRVMPWFVRAPKSARKLSS